LENINFVYWLKGFFEISDAKTLDEKQVQIIKDHLNLVFNKVTPNRSESSEGSTLKADSEVLNTDIFEGDKKYCSTTTFGLKDVSTKLIC